MWRETRVNSISPVHPAENIERPSVHIAGLLLLMSKNHHY
jgi:hypothetical protein